MNWTESPMHKYDPILASHKQGKHYNVVVKVPDSQASDLGSIPGQV